MRTEEDLDIVLQQHLRLGALYTCKQVDCHVLRLVEQFLPLGHVAKRRSYILWEHMAAANSELINMIKISIKGVIIRADANAGTVQMHCLMCTA